MLLSHIKDQTRMPMSWTSRGGPMNTPACGQSVKITIKNSGHRRKLRSSVREEMQRRRMNTCGRGSMIRLQPAVPARSLPWRQASRSSGCPADDSIPSTLSPCDAFMVSMSHWQGKSLCRHNIDRFACPGEILCSGTIASVSNRSAFVHLGWRRGKVWLTMRVHWWTVTVAVPEALRRISNDDGGAG